ncbi:aurora other [Chlorella sorokiniana]|uniref:Aurora other n=1 Tax=Chlorella sorokiniana TaxID=3076 RepID=A0A2P6TSM8_CHLSO|nr:aurora other [Chlorella sorokiniana]|eukprot:PRW57075.1 aurora other [Chlorella sorokiniana]
MERSNGHWCLSDFALGKQLYKGKASTLYQATDKVSGVVVALKSYSKRRLSDLNWYQVEREIRLHSQLRHPNIIQLYAAFEDDNYVFMVTEFAAGGDLYEDLKRSGGQHRERVVAGDLLPPFMSALAYMHTRSVVHRDIKPENILLTADRTVKVADFGLSINWGEERPVTRAGTLDYMSPEVLLCPEKSRPDENKEKVELGYTDAVDVWAAGILAYELLVGRPPFERETREETYAWITKREPALPSWMSDGAKQFITAALAKSARKRPSMAELLHHPWILQHMRRPSTPSVSPLHLPLHELAGEGASPFGELHRASLHGAKSCRDFAALLHAPSAGPAGFASMLSPAASANASALAAAAAAAAVADGPAAARPTTSSSRLGLGGSLGSRPGTPSTALLSSSPAVGATVVAAPSPPASPSIAVRAQAPAAASSTEAGRASQQAPQQAGVQIARATSGHGFTAATADGSFFSAASFVTASSTSASIETSGHSFTHSVAALRALSSSMGLPQAAAAAPAAAEPPSGFLELYKSMAPPPAPAERTSHHSPRGGLPARKGSGSRSVGSPGGSAGSSSKSLDAASLPPLAGSTQQHPGQESSALPPLFSATARLPSLRKAISSPALQDLAEGGMPAGGAPAPTAAQDVEELPAAGLDPIPEQRSSESEPASQLDSVSVLVQTAAKKQPAAAEAQGEAGTVAAGGFISAVHISAGDGTSSSHMEQREAAAAPQQAEQGAEEGRQAADVAARGGSKSPRHRPSEQDVAPPPAATTASPTTSSDHRPAAGAAKSKSKQSPGGSSYGSGIAKSASSLLNKLLGRKPAAGAAATAGAASSAPTATIAHVPDVPVSMPAAPTATASPPSGKQKQRLSPAPLQIRAYATSSSSRDYTHVHGSGYGQLASPRSRGSPAGGSPSSAGLVRRVPSSKLAGGTSPSAPAPVASAAPASSQQASAGPPLRCTSTKGVRFADAAPADLAPAGPSGNVEDLIRAVHGPEASETLSFTSAYSSLPASSLPSLTAEATSPSASRKNSAASLSPPVSRKGSLAAGGPGARMSLARLPSGRSMAAAKPRGSRMASLPGDGAGKAAGAGGQGGSAAKHGPEEEEEAVQRSAASWSHPAAASSAGRAAAAHKSSASAARLSMYKQMMAGSAKHSLHKPGVPAGGHSPPPAGKTKH